MSSEERRTEPRVDSGGEPAEGSRRPIDFAALGQVLKEEGNRLLATAYSLSMKTFLSQLKPEDGYINFCDLPYKVGGIPLPNMTRWAVVDPGEITVDLFPSGPDTPVRATNTEPCVSMQLGWGLPHDTASFIPGMSITVSSPEAFLELVRKLESLHPTMVQHFERLDAARKQTSVSTGEGDE